MALVSIRLKRNARLQNAAVNGPPLKSGEPNSSAVDVLQTALVDLKFPLPLSTKRTGFADGIFGKETTAAVVKFQTKEGLLRDGIVGRQTLGRLDQLFSATEAKGAADARADRHRPIPRRRLYGS